MAEAVSPSEADIASTARAEARRKWLSRLALVIVVIAVVFGLWYVLIGRNHVSTDDAYVNVEAAQVTPMVAGQVIAVHVKDTQAVKAGDVLVEIDPVDARIAAEQADADLAAARRRFRQTVATSGALGAQVSQRGADISQMKAQLATAQADFDKARIDLQRRETLAGSGAVSGEELTNARKTFAAAQATLNAAKASIDAAQSGKQNAQGQLAANDALVTGLTEDTDPAVKAAKAKLDAAKLDLQRTVIRAPVDGVVTKRSVQLGQRVAAGSPIMSIVPVDHVYIDANFKERQLRKVRIGMPATVTADIYGSGVTYHGKVAGIAGGTGSSLALIPAQNATGNWIKVVQRLPVRIELDPKELAQHPLRIGLSTEVEIELTDK